MVDVVGLMVTKGALVMLEVILVWVDVRTQYSHLIPGTMIVIQGPTAPTIYQ